MNPIEERPMTDLHRLELRISQLLRMGVMVAGGLLLVGWLWMLFNNGDVLATFQEYRPQALTQTLEWAFITRDRALILSFVGLLILVTLPVVRVLLTGILFLKQKEYRLATMAFLVFVALVSSFFLGIDL